MTGVQLVLGLVRRIRVAGHRKVHFLQMPPACLEMTLVPLSRPFRYHGDTYFRKKDDHVDGMRHGERHKNEIVLPADSCRCSREKVQPQDVRKEQATDGHARGLVPNMRGEDLRRKRELVQVDERVVA